MSGNNRDIPSGTVQQRSSPRGLFTPELRDLILPPLKIGTWTGKSYPAPMFDTGQALRFARDLWRSDWRRSVNFQRNQPFYLGHGNRSTLVYSRIKFLVSVLLHSSNAICLADVIKLQGV